MISEMRRWIVVLALIASLGYAERAAAAEVVALDDQGRAIRFDVRVDKVDADWYARLLRAAPHGTGGAQPLPAAKLPSPPRRQADR